MKDMNNCRYRKKNYFCMYKYFFVNMYIICSVSIYGIY